VYTVGESHLSKKLKKKDKNSKNSMNDYVISSMRKREGEVDKKQATKNIKW
jgi:hypothetical protein